MKFYNRQCELELLDLLYRSRISLLVLNEILIEEFGREHATYYEIISAIARGRCSLSEISDMSHVSANSLAPYFYDLIDLLGIVEHRIPVTDVPKKKQAWKIFPQGQLLQVLWVLHLSHAEPVHGRKLYGFDEEGFAGVEKFCRLGI